MIPSGWRFIAVTVAACLLCAAGVFPYSRGLNQERLFNKRVPYTSREANVILVSIDTLRPDHLGCYGYPRDTSPNIDSFRQDAVLFNQCLAPAPNTTPSHMSMFTSLIPQHHRVPSIKHISLPRKMPILGELFSRAGYACAGWTGGGNMDGLFGFSRGFDYYQTFTSRFEQKVGNTIEWIEANKTRNFLSFCTRTKSTTPTGPPKT